MKKLVAALAVAVMAAPALGQPYDARGSFNGWGQTAMTDDMDGSWSVTISGLTAGDRHEWKIDTGNWASSWPGSNAKSAVDASGEMNLHFYPGPAGDTWNPAGDRVGYDDSGQHGWEISGGFNGWQDGTDANAAMTDQGGGLYTVDYTIATAGTYDWKFKELGSWDISIGGDFGNAAGNNSVTTTSDNETWTFELDLPNGRWRITPEPTTLALLGLGALALVRRRR